MKLIGLTGHAQHGKDTTAALLVEEYGFTRYAFADALKSMAVTLNPIVARYPFNDGDGDRRLRDLVTEEGWEAAKQNPEVRRFLQVLGTEGVRDHLGTEAWVQALELQVEKDGPEKVVISDVRFPNEVEWVKANLGEVWRIKRRNPDGTPFDNGIGTDHPSERAIGDLYMDKLIVATDVPDLRMKVVREMRGE